jgi:hypothetical protein
MWCVQEAARGLMGFYQLFRELEYGLDRIGQLYSPITRVMTS